MPSNLQDISFVLLLWLTAGTGLLTLSVVVITRSRQLSLRALWRGERGGTYSISLLMVLPLFTTLVALFIECNHLMLTKLGTYFAAYSAARSAAVWLPIDIREAANAGLEHDTVPTQSLERCRLAAARAMTPFTIDVDRVSESTLPQRDIERLLRLATGFEQPFEPVHPAPDYLRRKFVNAYSSTQVELTSPATKQRKQYTQVAATVKHQAEFLVPGIGRLLSTLGNQGFGRAPTWPLSTTVALHVDFPRRTATRTEAYSIGVRYGEANQHLP